MRPVILSPLFAPLTALPGVGAHIAKRLQKLLKGDLLVDLVMFRPRNILRRKQVAHISDLHAGMTITISVTIKAHYPPPYTPNRRTSQSPYRIDALDQNQDILSIVFFRADANYLKRVLPVDEIRVISGKIEAYGERIQMPHPDYIELPARAQRIPKIEPIYPLTAGISNRILAKHIQFCLDKKIPDFPEWLDHKWTSAQQAWPSFNQALIQLHNPSDQLELLDADDMVGDVALLQQKAGLRLAYDELFANQLALAFVRKRLTSGKGRAIIADGFYRDQLLQLLPFSLTRSQDQILEEIFHDMRQQARMLRLVQGDVGSGKTIIALLAMLFALEAERDMDGGKPVHQAAMLAPTEILARQHFETISKLVEPLGLRCVLLTGRGKSPQAKRKQALAAIKSGTANIIIGTHALFQSEVEYHNLALVIIDEQHRFGVHQRLSLSDKGNRCDILVMTATPIPRTLMLSAYGDLDHSRLTEKPPGRKPIHTVVIAKSRIDQVIRRLAERLEAGDQAYWVCPLVEESEHLSLISAQQRAQELIYFIEQLKGEAMANSIGLIHGKMKPAEKEQIMSDFQAGKIALLVATTVIEVGVDVPNACIMVIEHAEQFGLSQLHQLRGRVGRGTKPSSCVLLRNDHIGDTAYERLKIISQSEDGMMIAEKDLELRGAGEVLGVKQSGLPEFHFADLAVHKDLMAHANRDALACLKDDPSLGSKRGDAIRLLLYLFRYDQAIHFIQSG
ncbi:MAG: ATP-dependent DNA helicase RecG [Alphaproteobacteria bacterium]